MDFESYSHFWDHQAATPESALAAVDGSASEEIVRKTGTWTASQMKHALGLDGSQRVLELGCGVGRIGRELSVDCREWVGVDISSSMLKVAAERLSDRDNVSFHHLTRTDLAMLEDDSFDAVYSVAVLCHMDKEDLYLYLREIRRVLKPGGIAYLETWNLADPMGWKRWSFEVRTWDKSSQTERKNVSRNQFCTPDEFSLYIRQAGLTEAWQWSASPWVQSVMTCEMNDDDHHRVTERLDSTASNVIYSEKFSALFGQLIDVVYGVIQPDAMWTDLLADEQSKEVVLFRDYLKTLWANGPEHWGQPPED